MAGQFSAASMVAADIQRACGRVCVCMCVCIKPAQHIIVRGKGEHHNRKGVFYCQQKNCHVLSKKNMRNVWYDFRKAL